MSYKLNEVNVATNKTLVDADQGTVQNVTATSTLTLPAAAAGKTFVVQNGGQGATAGNVTVTVAAVGTDTVTGNGFTPAATKGPVNTLGEYGNRIVLVGGTGTWHVAENSGVWTRQV